MKKLDILTRKLRFTNGRVSELEKRNTELSLKMNYVVNKLNDEKKNPCPMCSVKTNPCETCKDRDYCIPHLENQCGAKTAYNLYVEQYKTSSTCKLCGKHL